MVLSVVLLNPDEQFIEFLDTDLLNIEETTEEKSIRTCNVEYLMTDVDHAKDVFKLGNKLWVSGDKHIEDCLYVINEDIDFNLFQDNTISFDIEEVLVELNNAPFFSQTDLTEKNGFTISTVNNEPHVLVNRAALEFWFGDYFNIGIIQSCLSPNLQKIAPNGTMTLMSLLRYIEEETSNVFITRYEKDPQKNIIHRYLDFLNPDSNLLYWDLKAEFEYYEEESPNNITIDDETTVSEVIENEDDIVIFPEFKHSDPLDFDNLILKIINENEELINVNLSENGLNGTAEIYTFLISYTANGLSISITGKNIAPTSGEITSQKNNSMITYTTVESVVLSPEEIVLSNNCLFEIMDVSTEKIVYSQKISPQLGNVQPQILNLGYNMEDIDFEVSESDTFTAIAPVIKVSDVTDSNSLSRKNYDTLIKRWINLKVKKGDLVPMIIQKTNSSIKPSARSASVVSSAYWSRPLKPNDQTDGDDKRYEYLEGTAYWYAPFSKLKGEIFVADDTDTGVDYNQIKGRPDVHESELITSMPKIGSVETSEEDVYAIFNAVCMKLKDKRYPAVNVKAKVANFVNGFDNNFGLYDKVFLKVPGVDSLVTAKVIKTMKNPKAPHENTVELDSYSISSKAVQKDTEILANNLGLKYPNKKKLNVTLLDDEGNAIPKKKVTFAVFKVDDSGSSFRKAYTKTTNNNGIATLQVGFKPGNYTIDITFGGDVVYGSSANSVSVNVSGTIVKKSKKTDKSSASKKSKVSKNKTKTKIVKRFWGKCGQSPDKKQVISISQPSGRDSYKYSYNQLWKTVFKNKCPYCGKAELRWDDGRRNGCIKRNGHTGNKTDVPEGEITCNSCDCDYDGVTGLEKMWGSNRRLTTLKKPVKSNSNEKNNLLNGKLLFDSKKVKVKVKKVNSKKPRKQDTRTSFPVTQTGKVSKSVRSKAISIVEDSTGIPAAKKIIKWVAKHIKWEDRNDFYQSPATTLRRKKGNCCCQADLAAQMLYIVGVMDKVDVRYVHVHKPGKGHVFLRINKIYCDPCKTSNPWGHYITGYGVPGSGPITKYPRLPFERSY